MVKRKRKGGKIKARPVRASKQEPTEVTPAYIMARQKQRKKALRVREQPRTAGGRFGRKPTSDYDLGPQDFYAKQHGKLEKGEISASTYARYARKYEQRNPQYKFRGDRYQLTIQVTGEKDGQEIQWRIITEANEVELTEAKRKELTQNLKEMYGDYLKIKSVRLYATYDKYYRARGGAARLVWRP